MRERSRTTIIAPTDAILTCSYGNEGVQTGQKTGRAIRSGVHESILDVIGPEFKIARRRGLFVVRPCKHLKVVRRNFTKSDTFRADYVRQNGTIEYGTHILQQDVGALDVYWPTGWGFWENNPENLDSPNFYIDHPDPLGQAYRRNQVLGAAYAQAGKADMQSLVSIAEFRKTLNSAERLATLLPRFQRWWKAHRYTLRVRGELFRATGDLARQWLEYRYGFMQLYYDYNSLCKAMTRKTGSYRIVHARWDGSRHAFDTKFDRVYDGPHTDWSGSLDATRSSRIRAGVIIKCDPLSDFCRAWGLSSPLSTAWELVPFSFIVDWFINVSDALAAFEGRFTQNVVASWISEQTTARLIWRTWQQPKRTPNGGDAWVGSVGWDVTTQEDIEHYVRIADPKYYFSLPEFKLRMNWKRFLDLSAMLRQLRRDV